MVLLVFLGDDGLDDPPEAIVVAGPGGSDKVDE